MEIKAAGNIPYTEKQFNDYKKRLARILIEKGLDSDTIINNTEAKTFIVNYVKNELINPKKDNERLLLNLNIRLVNIDINTPTGKKVYPIINEYKVHHLIKTYYFYKEKDTNDIKIGIVEVKNTPIILI